MLILMVVSLLGCERTHDGKRLVLEWKDAGANVAFRVTEAPGAVVKQNSRLHVERDGKDHAVIIDDDAIFSTVAFVRHERWLLVVCRGVDEVWAGYDYEAGRLYGEGDWGKLPFTKWSGQGKVVAERKLHDESASPANFPPPSGGRMLAPIQHIRRELFIRVATGVYSFLML
jgi:hypothetical protein